MLFNKGQGPLIGRFRLNIRKIVFIRDVVKHHSRSSTEAGEFLLKSFESQRKLWLMCSSIDDNPIVNLRLDWTIL